ncbi:MAG: HAD family hydrolase [Spirochaetaceae bacterium]
MTNIKAENVKAENVKAENVKAIFLDMDGTVLDDTGTVSPEVQLCLKQIINRDIPIYLASGRSYESMLPTHGVLGLKTPLIAYNGAQLIEPVGNKVIKQNLLKPRLVTDAVIIAKKHNVYVQFYIDKKVYYIGSKEMATEYSLKSGVVPELLNESGDYYEKCTNGMFLVSELNCNNKLLLDISDELNSSNLWKEEGSHFLSSLGTLEFSNKGISKGNMISYLLESSGINRVDTIAIGDGLNDREMILNAGLGIAMGNAAPELKSIADLIILSNSEHGISKFFNQFFDFI